MWVEEHLDKCEECRGVAETMKNTEISAMCLEAEGLDAAKKIKRKQLHRSLLNLGLSLAMAVFMVFVFAVDQVQIPHIALYVTLPVWMGMSWLVCKNQTTQRPWDKWDTLALAGALLAIGYGMFMMLYGFSQVIKGETLFGVPLNKLGPFLYKQMIFSAVSCFGFYLLQIVRTMKHGRNNSVLMNLCLTGIFMMMAYCVYMGNLSELEMAVRQLKVATVTILLIGILVTGVFGVLDVVLKRRNG